jgi:hypothetical protein
MRKIKDGDLVVIMAIVLDIKDFGEQSFLDTYTNSKGSSILLSDIGTANAGVSVT